MAGARNDGSSSGGNRTPSSVVIVSLVVAVFVVPSVAGLWQIMATATANTASVTATCDSTNATTLTHNTSNCKGCASTQISNTSVMNTRAELTSWPEKDGQGGDTLDEVCTRTIWITRDRPSCSWRAAC